MQILRAMLKDALLLKASDLILQSSKEPQITWQGRTEALEDHGVVDASWLMGIGQQLFGQLYTSLSPGNPQKATMTLADGKLLHIIAMQNQSLTLHFFLPPHGEKNSQSYWSTLTAQGTTPSDPLSLDISLSETPPHLEAPSPPAPPVVQSVSPPPPPPSLKQDELTPKAPKTTSVQNESKPLSPISQDIPMDLFGAASVSESPASEPAPLLQVEDLQKPQAQEEASLSFSFDPEPKAPGEPELEFQVDVPFEMDPGAHTMRNEMVAPPPPPTRVPSPAPDMAFQLPQDVPAPQQNFQDLASEPVVLEPIAAVGVRNGPIVDIFAEMKRLKVNKLQLSPGSGVIFRNAEGQLVKGSEILSDPRIRELVSPLIPMHQNSPYYDKGANVDFYVERDQEFFRVHFFQALGGNSVLLHRLPTEVASLQSLSLEAKTNLCTLPHGLVLVVGTDCEKRSKILSAFASHINHTRPARILMIEKPLSCYLRSHVGVVVQKDPGMHTPSFASALACALREDANVLVVGTITDPASAKHILEASTRSLVFAGICAVSAEEGLQIFHQLLADRPGAESLVKNVLRDLLSS